MSAAARGVAHGVVTVSGGKDEEPLPPVRRANFRRRKESRRNRKIQRVKIVGHHLICGASVRCSQGEQRGHVLEEHESGLALANDPGDVGPQVALVLDAALLPGDGEWCARKSSHEAIDEAAPGSPVEGPHVRPDRGTIQPSVVHASAEESLAERLSLAVGDDARRGDGELEPAVERADSRAQREDIHRLSRIAARVMPDS